MKTKVLAGLSMALFLLASFSVAGMAVHAAPPGTVYTEDNAAGTNHVLEYQSGPNGVLSLVCTLPCYSTGGSGTGSNLGSQGAVVLTQDGHWLLVVDAGSNQITVFQVSGDGSLTWTDTVASQGTMPISLAVTNNNQIVYVLNEGFATTPSTITPGNIAGFTLNNGQLTLIAGSVQPLSSSTAGGCQTISTVSYGTCPEQIGFSNDGSVLVVTEKAAGVIDLYSVGHNGVASAPSIVHSNGNGPYGFAVNNQGYLILSEAAGGAALCAAGPCGTVSSYALTDSPAAMRTISGSIPDFGNAPCWVALSHNGQFAYASNAHGGTISVYSISGQGVIALTSSLAATLPTAHSLDLATSGNGQYLYDLNGGQITSFQTYNDGGISQASTIAGVPASATGLAAT